MTGLLLTCSYNNQEFFRVGYYVNNYYEDPELNENPPVQPDIERLTRHILVEKPRVTKYQIQWEDESTIYNENNPNQMNVMGQQTSDELPAGSQFKDRNDMMSHANLQAAQNFFAQ